jgi:dynein heavy chain, axonemal
VREYIRQLPTEDQPEVFGLHANAAITFQQKESRTLINSIVTCSGGGGSGGGGGAGGDSNDQRVRDVASKISDRMPGTFDLRQAHPETFKKIGDATTSLGVFLGQELIRFNGLIEVMVATLHQLQVRGQSIIARSPTGYSFTFFPLYNFCS